MDRSPPPADLASVSNGVALGVPLPMLGCQEMHPTFSTVPWSWLGPSPSVLLNQKLKGHTLSRTRL